MCQCPHWGYVFDGRTSWRYADREEVVEAGEACYVPPGHTQLVDAGCRFLSISPTEAPRPTDEAVQHNMQALQQS